MQKDCEMMEECERGCANIELNPPLFFKRLYVTKNNSKI
jgi:hypothetical protein